MTDDITKILRKSSQKDRERILEIFKKIKNKDLSSLDIKKIKGEKNQFRVRSGQYRILFEERNDSFVVLWVKKRDKRTY